MLDEGTYRVILAAGFLIVFPFMLYQRVKSQATREHLDRSQEGLLILATLRPVGLTCLLALITYLVNPAWMAWSAMPVPAWARLTGVAVWAIASALLAWTLRSLGPNLTDTVVTRKVHALVTTGPYRWVRHPFYDSVYLLLVASALIAANWLVLLSGTLVFVLLAVRTATEERNLLARFGESYRQYRQATGRFLPRAAPASSHVAGAPADRR